MVAHYTSTPYDYTGPQRSPSYPLLCVRLGRAGEQNREPDADVQCCRRTLTLLPYPRIGIAWHTVHHLSNTQRPYQARCVRERAVSFSTLPSHAKQLLHCTLPPVLSYIHYDLLLSPLPPVLSYIRIVARAPVGWAALDPLAGWRSTGGLGGARPACWLKKHGWAGRC